MAGVPRLAKRVVIAGTHSGAGKTTVATGIMAALAARSVRVAGAKVGPDFIDPGYHAIATGRPSRNLDAWLSGTDAIAPLAAQASSGCDVLVVEGVMGLFDGSGDPEGPDASTAQVARLLAAPVILVVDASAMSGSVAALVSGFAGFDRSVQVSGVILNRVGSEGHETMLRDALAGAGMPVLGVLRRDEAFRWRDRHLGLVPVVEDLHGVRQSVRDLAGAIERDCELDAIVAIASSTAPLNVGNLSRSRPPIGAPAAGSVPVAIASGPAFSFYYPDNLEALERAGAELLPFDPATSDALPAGAAALYAGGGFPEVFVEELAANRPLLDHVRRQVHAGLPVWAECGGLLWLSRSLNGRRLAGAVAADAQMTDRLSLGYRRIRPATDTPLAPAGTEMRAHEFHYSATDPSGEGLEWRGRTGSGRCGFASRTMLASYMHLHLGADGSPAERFVQAAARWRG